MGFVFDIEGMKMCCACALREAYESGSPHLFVLANRPTFKSDTGYVCCVCGQGMEHHTANRALGDWEKLLTGEK